MWKAFLGGIGGAIATLLVSTAPPISGWIAQQFSNASIENVLSNLETKTYAGEEDNNGNYTAACHGSNEILIGGYCQVNSQKVPSEGALAGRFAFLQNAGSTNNGKSYTCVFHAENRATFGVWAVCLGRKNR